jgi:endo-1,4-beta-xylanase
MSLAAIGKRRGIAFGSAMSYRLIDQDPRYTALIVDQCSTIVPSNELKWTAIRPDPATINYQPADTLLAWAETNKLAIRGHNLFWPLERRSPPWQATFDYGANPHATAEKMLVEHVERTCRRYGARIASWDVINEGIDPATGIARQNGLSKAFGDTVEMMDLCFHTARANLPAATELVYNDFMSWEPTHEKHRDGVLRLLEGFRKRRVPVDTLGIQGHLGGGGTTGNPDGIGGFGAHDERAWRGFLDEVAAMGYRMLISEFDINDRFLTGSIAERDARIAAYGKAFLDATLSYRQLHTVMLWGISDNRSWLQGTGARPDGLPKRPAPYDAELNPKPLRAAIANALSHAPQRKT